MSTNLPTVVVRLILQRRRELDVLENALSAYNRLRRHLLSRPFAQDPRLNVQPTAAAVSTMRQRLRGQAYRTGVSTPLADYNHWIRFRFNVGAEGMRNPYGSSVLRQRRNADAARRRRRR